MTEPVPPALDSELSADEGRFAATIEGAAIGDRIYQGAITFFALCVPLLLLFIAWEILIGSWEALGAFGAEFVTSSRWDPVAGVYGAAPAIIGTLVTSIIALIIATPLALGVAIFLSEYAPPWLRQPIGFLVDLLAAIPSVIYGLWGIFVLIPILRGWLVPFLTDTLGLDVLPLFSGPFFGSSVLAAGVILAIMVLPYISAVAREVLLAVPRSQREAALALGATKWEMIRGAVIPFAKSGIVGGIILGLGRALGETMAVTMVIGNRLDISGSLLAPGVTLASQIANQFVEATGDLQLSALMGLALLLFVITVIVNAIARWLIWQTSRERRA